jgi:hypothetical protein
LTPSWDLFVYAKDLFVEASLLTALSALGALVFTALLVVLLAEALDAHRRRR